MGPEIIVISGFRDNRGQKSADLVISQPRNNSSSNLSELGLFDFWILVVLALTRIIKSVVTGQAPVTLKLRNTPGKNTNNPRWYTHIITADAIHASTRNFFLFFYPPADGEK